MGPAQMPLRIPHHDFHGLRVVRLLHAAPDTQTHLRPEIERGDSMTVFLHHLAIVVIFCLLLLIGFVVARLL